MSSFVDTLVKLSATVGEALGGPMVPALVDIGKSVLTLIDETSKTASTTDLPTLEQARDELEPKVMAHADKTEASLR